MTGRYAATAVQTEVLAFLKGSTHFSSKKLGAIVRHWQFIFAADGCDESITPSTVVGKSLVRNQKLFHGIVLL